MFSFLDLAKFTKELEAQLPEKVPDNPVYIDFHDGKLVIPEVVSRAKAAETRAQETVEPAPEDTVESAIEEELMIQNDDSSDGESQDAAHNTRYNWKFHDTKLLLKVLSEKKEKNQNFAIIKHLWGSVAKELEKELKKNKPNSGQCREKFYALKTAYRSFISESGKTGNRRQKPFLYETEMHDLLHNDPAFRPPKAS